MNASKPQLIDFRMNILRKDEDPGLKRRRELFQVISLKEAFPSSVFLFKNAKSRNPITWQSVRKLMSLL